MDARSWWQAALWGAMGGAVALGGTLLFREREPARTALELVDGACGSGAPERLHLLTKHVAATLQVEIDGGDDDGEPTEFERLRAGLSGRRARARYDSGEFKWTHAQLGLKLAELNELSPNCQLSLHDYNVDSGDDGSEWLTGDLDYSASQPGDLHADRRRVRAQFRRTGDDVRLERLLLGPVERRVPEARP